MSELKVHLYQASFNPSHPCGANTENFFLRNSTNTKVGRGTTKIILLNYISVPLPAFYRKWLELLKIYVPQTFHAIITKHNKLIK